SRPAVPTVARTMWPGRLSRGGQSSRALHEGLAIIAVGDCRRAPQRSPTSTSARVSALRSGTTGPQWAEPLGWTWSDRRSNQAATAILSDGNESVASLINVGVLAAGQDALAALAVAGRKRAGRAYRLGAPLSRFHERRTAGGVL